MRRSIAIAGLSGALLAGGAAGALIGNPVLSGAQSTTTTSPDPTEATPTAPAPAGEEERSTWLADAIAPLVTDGTITQAQADAVVGALEAARPEGGPGGWGGGHGDRMGVGLDAAATALGMTEEEVRTALEGGSTLGQLADTAGVDRTALVDALVAPAQERLAEKVTAGDLTQAEADQKLDELRTRITEGLDQTPPVGGPGHDGRGPGRWGGDRDGDPAAPAAPSTDGSTGTTS